MILSASTAVAHAAELGDPACDPGRVRQQLDTLRRSRTFERSARLMHFLTHIVEARIAAEFHLLTESAIGKAIYGSTRDYDARIDSTVRVEARRLRRKLEEYYRDRGHEDEVIIRLPVGCYVPTFGLAREGNRALGARVLPFKAFAASFEGFDTEGLALAVMPVTAVADHPRESRIADTLTNELIFRLGRLRLWRVLSRRTVDSYLSSHASQEEFARALGVDMLLHGTVRCGEDKVRITIEIADTRGFIVWNDRVETASSEDFELVERIAAAIVDRLGSRAREFPRNEHAGSS